MKYTREELISSVQALREEIAKASPAIKQPLRGEVEYIPGREGDIRVIIYRPENQVGLLPVYFDSHGGGFVLRSADVDDHICDEIRNELGIVVISIDYRLAPEYPYPAAINDVNDVITYICNNAEKYGIDTKHMAIGGHSAGGTISTVICMQALKDKNITFKCQVLDYPPLDMYTLEKRVPEGQKADPRAPIFNACYCSEDQAKDPYVSPVFAEKSQLKGMPPAIILTAELDMLCDEAENYAMKLIEAGVEVTIRRFMGAVHGFTMFPNPMCEAGHKMMIDGIRKYI